MRTVSLELAAELMDFASTATAGMGSFASAQLEGATMAYNQLARNGVAYLADEVGMGKTYVALGVMGLLRHLEPAARVLVVAPRENIQRKWIKELGNFVNLNWRLLDNRVKSIQGTAAREPVYCPNLREFLREALLNPDRDFFLRMTSFSVVTKRQSQRRAALEELSELVPWIDQDQVPLDDPEEFKRAYGQAVNLALPEIDLLVVDEGHNLKHGFAARSSTRNALLASIFGHPGCRSGAPRGYSPKAKRLLLLSATPFEYDYADLHRQLDLFGFGEQSLLDAEGTDPRPVASLANPEISDEQKRELVGRFLIRRISHLTIAGKRHTKNMYRREWRQGGYAAHDQPLASANAKERLVIGLVQKKVAEVLGDQRFNQHFQVGMLSSFESFVESATQEKWKEEGNGNPDEPVFDGDQVADAPDEEARETRRREREGIDTRALARLVGSYRERFGHPLPHPKLDATAAELSRVFDTGEKALVFVRRLATMDELKARLDDVFNEWIRKKMCAELPELVSQIEELFGRFAAERRRKEQPRLAADEYEGGGVEEDTEKDTDEGGFDSFFAWFFRGKGPPGVLSGAAFQKNRLASKSSAYSILFEDDFVSLLLGRPADVLAALAAQLELSPEDLTTSLRGRAYALYRTLTRQREGYPRHYVFEAYQAAALELLSRAGGDLGDRAAFVLRARFEISPGAPLVPPEGFPPPATGIGITTVVTELARDSDLERRLLPASSGADFKAAFIDRERRRELLSAMARLGAAYVDLYICAIRRLGSFELGKEVDGAATSLAGDFVALLKKQEQAPGFHAFRELALAAEAFDVLATVNFPDVRATSLPELATLYGRVLTSQSPVATSRGKLARLVQQFRMPGYPLVLVTTDRLQEGEDLHTFCRKVVHYGITWTPSGMEQRTGRIDRIGGLVQRRLDGKLDPAAAEDYIQVYYPHLRDTVEVLQTERVFARMNRFLRLMHRDLGQATDEDSRIDAKREILALRDTAPIRTPLVSAFPGGSAWLRGDVKPPAERRLDLAALSTHLRGVWEDLVTRLGIDEVRQDKEFVREGSIFVEGGDQQAFSLELRSQTGTETVLLRCTSPVGPLALDETQVEELYELQRELGLAKVCARFDTGQHHFVISVEGDTPFDPRTTQALEAELLLRRTVRAAHQIRRHFLEEEEEVPAREAVRDDARLDSFLRDLAAREGLDITFQRERNTLRGTWPNGRSHRCTVERVGHRYVFTSTVLEGAAVNDWEAGWQNLVAEVWERNAQSEVVTFAFDADDRLVGRIDHPAATMDAEEFEFYVLTLLRACDRLEHALTGKDKS